MFAAPHMLQVSKHVSFHHAFLEHVSIGIQGQL